MHFERGLPLEIKSKLKLLYANTIQAAFAAALKIEATLSMKKGIKQEPSAAINAIDEDVAMENETIKEFNKLKEEVMALREEAKQNQRAVNVLIIAAIIITTTKSVVRITTIKEGRGQIVWYVSNVINQGTVLEIAETHPKKKRRKLKTGCQSCLINFVRSL